MPVLKYMREQLSAIEALDAAFGRVGDGYCPPCHTVQLRSQVDPFHEAVDAHRELLTGMQPTSPGYSFFSDSLVWMDAVAVQISVPDWEAQFFDCDWDMHEGTSDGYLLVAEGVSIKSMGGPLTSTCLRKPADGGVFTLQSDSWFSKQADSILFQSRQVLSDCRFDVDFLY